MLPVSRMIIVCALLLIGNACTSSSSLSSSLEVGLTDAPITIGSDTITKALVTISDVSVHTSKTAGANDPGWIAISLNNATNVDLLTLQNNLNQILGSQGLAAGEYQQFRLTVASAQLTFSDNSTATVTIPSGVVRLNFDVTIAANTKYGVTLDFSAQDSFQKVNNAWRMAPPVITVKEIYRINADGSHTTLRRGSGAICNSGDTCQVGSETCCVEAGTTGLCVDLTSDPGHCGSCTNDCPGSDLCTAGNCTAP